jgi:hypothetical protein
MSTLRTATIRLAYENPNLRPVLLPLLVGVGVRVAVRKWKDKEKMEAYLADHPGANPDNHEVVGGGEDEGGDGHEKIVYKKPTKEQVARAKREAPKTKWKKPDLEEEQGEIERTALGLGIENYEDIMAAGKKAKLEPLDDGTWSQLENTDSYDTDTVKKADRLAQEYNRDIASVFDGMGKELPSPLVIFREGEPPYLVGGNTRLMASRALGHTPKVLAIRL